MTLALSTPVWRVVKFAVTFPFRPLETVECDTSGDEASSKSGNQKAKAKKRQLRRFQKANKKTEDYHESDFWPINRENVEDKYEIPSQNRQPEQPADGKPRSWGSSHKSLSLGKGKKNQDKAANQPANASV